MWRQIIYCWFLLVAGCLAVCYANDSTDYIQKYDCRGLTVKIDTKRRVVWQNEDERLFTQERYSIPRARLVWAPGQGLLIAGDAGALYSGNSGQQRRQYQWSDAGYVQDATFDTEGNVYLAVDGRDNGEDHPPQLTIIKKNGAGETVWSRPIEADGYRYASPAEIKIIAGNSVLVAGTLVAEDYTDRRLFVAKIDGQGGLTWTAEYPDAATDGRAVLSDDDGDIYVAGVRKDYDWRDETRFLTLGKLNGEGRWLWRWISESSIVSGEPFNEDDSFRLFMRDDQRVTLVCCRLTDRDNEEETIVFPSACEAVAFDAVGHVAWSSADLDLPQFNTLTTAAMGNLLFSGMEPDSYEVESYLHTYYYQSDGNRLWTRLYPPLCLPESEIADRKGVTTADCAELAARVVGGCGFKVHSPTGAELTQAETREWCEATVAAWGGTSPDSKYSSYWTCLEDALAQAGCNADSFAICEELWIPDYCCARHYRREYDCGHPKILSEDPLFYYPRLDAYGLCSSWDEPVACLADCAEDFCNDEGAEYRACMAACWENDGEDPADYDNEAKYAPLETVVSPAGTFYVIGAELAIQSQQSKFVIMTYDAEGNLLNSDHLKGGWEYNWPTASVLDENGALYVAGVSCRVYQTEQGGGSYGWGESDKETEPMCGCRTGRGTADPLAVLLILGGWLAWRRSRRAGRSHAE